MLLWEKQFQVPLIPTTNSILFIVLSMSKNLFFFKSYYQRHWYTACSNSHWGAESYREVWINGPSCWWGWAQHGNAPAVSCQSFSRVCFQDWTFIYDVLGDWIFEFSDRYEVKVVPILVGALSAENEAMYGQLLAKYIDDPKNFFSVSSDFCHWGSRYVHLILFYQFYVSIVDFLCHDELLKILCCRRICFLGHELLSPWSIHKIKTYSWLHQWSSQVYENLNKNYIGCYLYFTHLGLLFVFRFRYTYYDKTHGAIYKSIEALDKMGMDIIETGDPDAFKQYLLETDNTICGRHPISVFLHVNISTSIFIYLFVLEILWKVLVKEIADSLITL